MNGESGHPCLISVLSRMAFSFSLLSLILAMVLGTYGLFILKYFPSIPILFRIVIINGCCILNGFCASIGMIMCFILHFVNVVCQTLVLHFALEADEVHGALGNLQGRELVIVHRALRPFHHLLVGDGHPGCLSCRKAGLMVVFAMGLR